MLAIGGYSGVAQPAFNNITEGATLYSTLASVLSGFAFTAIVLLVVTWLGDSVRAQDVLEDIGAPLVASFFGLLIVALGDAAESTNPTNNGLVASENTVMATGFAAVGVLLLYTVVLMLDSYDALGLYENYEYGPNHPFTALDAFGAVLLLIEFFIMLYTCWLILRRPATDANRSLRESSKHLMSYRPAPVKPAMDGTPPEPPASRARRLMLLLRGSLPRDH